MTNTTKKQTKADLAREIVEKNPKATRSELVKMFMDKLGMSKAGASTYASNLAKNAPKRITKAAQKTAEQIAAEKLAAKRERDAARKREKRALAKAARELVAA